MSMVLQAVFLLAQAVGVAVALALTWVAIYLWNEHRKYAHIPGPKRSSFFLGNLLEMSRRFKNGSCLSLTLYDWCLEYGSTYHFFMLHQVFVVTNDPEGIKSSLVTEHFLKSEPFYEPISYLYGTRFLGNGLVSEIDHEAWSARRTVMNPAFSRGLLKPMMSDFNQLSDEFCKKLASLADGQTIITLLPELNKTTLDVIGKVAYGLDLNSLHDSKSPYNKAISKTMEGFREYTRNPIERRIPFARRAFKQEVREACEFLRKFAHQQLQSRREALNRGDYVPEDILSFIIKSQDELGGGPETVENTVDQFNTFFVAGQETTANTLAFVLMELGRHPDVYQKLRAEVDEVLGSRSDIDFNDLPKLVYCDHVIRETLRIYPPVSVTFRRVGREGFSIGPYAIPNGADITISTFVAGRHPDFTEDALSFKPERFADDKTKPSRYTTFPFALGPRNCIGQNFAKMEAKVVLAKFVQRFDMKLDPTQSFDIEETTTLKPKDGTRATLTIRG